VEKYDGTFALVDTFTDKKAKGYAPFNIGLIDGQLYVTFAVQNKERHDDVAGPGNGIVETFDLSGNMLEVFAQGGALNSPWGMAVAPASFGALSGKLLIGNFGDGRINAFDLAPPHNSSPVPIQLAGQTVVIDGLWSLKVGNGSNGGSNLIVYFTAGPNGEADGLFGALIACLSGLHCG
jgi:uncharacterized protein (TIGR03118 family)